jgi:hypothetical protein
VTTQCPTPSLTLRKDRQQSNVLEIAETEPSPQGVSK